jgi:hypothetical protein
MTATYQLTVTPLFEELRPFYEVMIYRFIEGGICSPITDTERIEPTNDALEAWVVQQGFTSSGKYSEVCANGFATSPIYKL